MRTVSSKSLYKAFPYTPSVSSTVLSARTEVALSVVPKPSVTLSSLETPGSGDLSAASLIKRGKQV